MTSPVSETACPLPRAPPPPGRSGYNPVILLLIGWDDNLPKDDSTGVSPFEAAVTSAVTSPVASTLEKLGIKDKTSCLDFLDHLLRWVPEENTQGKEIYDILVVVGFIFDQPSLKEYQTPISPESAGRDLTWLSSWLVTFSQVMGLWMDTRDSMTKESLATFANSPSYNVEEWGQETYTTFNEFFYRTLKDGSRPIASPDDPSTIVFPADCTFDVAFSIDAQDLISVKGLQWKIQDLLQGSKYCDEFEGGVWCHAFLNTYNYHRQHAPVAGEVLEAKVIHGGCYVGVAVSDDGDLQHVRGLPKLSADDGSGYQFLQTRGMIVIDGGPVGLVAVLPIGMSQVSGVILDIEAGDTVEKGQNIAHFKFGGSDIVVVFQAKAGLTVESFDGLDRDNYGKVGTVLAMANLQQ
ncbi:hypothetical protein ANO11243_062240 [Dothideomycetidae sp. 11243]|nr:hypothetical protein ANO11243_062240 [fungal sp. No.11243]